MNQSDNEQILFKLLSSDLREELINFDQNELSSLRKIFLKDLTELHRITMNELNITASQEMAKKKIIQDISRSTQKLKVKITNVEDSLQSEEKKLATTVVEKNLIIKKFEHEIENLKVLGDIQIEEQM